MTNKCSYLNIHLTELPIGKIISKETESGQLKLSFTSLEFKMIDRGNSFTQITTVTSQMINKLMQF